MSEFKDRSGQTWSVSLDAPLIEEIQEKHQVELVNLKADPLLPLRNDPMKLVAVTYLLCQDQIKERGIDARQFGKLLPSPPDAIIDAIAGAIVDFFPTGRASFVREVLTESERIMTKNEEVMMEEMRMMIDNPETRKHLTTRAKHEIENAINDYLSTTSQPAALSLPGRK